MTASSPTKKNDKTTKTAAPATAAGAAAPRVARTVAIACESAKDGRLPVTITVAPTAALDAKAGVFVDLRTGSKPEKVAGKPSLLKPGTVPLVSHQIAPGQTLEDGHAKTFRADIAMPEGAPTGETWYIRGRFATNGGKDLCSAWQAM